MAGDTSVTLTIVLNRTDQSGFDAFLHAVQDPSSPNFRHYLSQRELADRFGPITQAYDTVLEWLQQQGFTVVEGSANRLTITVRGTRAQTEQAFDIRMDDYRLGDRTFYANDRDPALPAAIASHVQAVVGLSNLARPVRAHSTDVIERGRRIGPVGDLAYSCWLATVLSTGGFALQFQKLVYEASHVLSSVSFGLALSPATTLLNFMCIADELNMLNRLAAGLPPNPSPLAATRLVSRSLSSPAGTGQMVGLLEFDNFHPSDHTFRTPRMVIHVFSQGHFSHA